jgi:hypothetical protein
MGMAANPRGAHQAGEISPAEADARRIGMGLGVPAKMD